MVEEGLDEYEPTLERLRKKKYRLLKAFKIIEAIEACKVALERDPIVEYLPWREAWKRVRDLEKLRGIAAWSNIYDHETGHMTIEVITMDGFRFSINVVLKPSDFIHDIINDVDAMMGGASYERGMAAGLSAWELSKALSYLRWVFQHITVPRNIEEVAHMAVIVEALRIGFKEFIEQLRGQLVRALFELTLGLSKEEREQKEKEFKRKIVEIIERDELSWLLLPTELEEPKRD